MKKKILINPDSGGGEQNYQGKLLQVRHRQLHSHRWKSSQRSINHHQVMRQDRLIKVLDLDIPGRFEQQNRVYCLKGISPTLNSAMGHGGNCVPMFLIVKKL